MSFAPVALGYIRKKLLRGNLFKFLHRFRSGSAKDLTPVLAHVLAQVIAQLLAQVPHFFHLDQDVLLSPAICNCNLIL